MSLPQEKKQEKERVGSFFRGGHTSDPWHELPATKMKIHIPKVDEKLHPDAIAATEAKGVHKAPKEYEVKYPALALTLQDVTDTDCRELRVYDVAKLSKDEVEFLKRMNASGELGLDAPDLKRFYTLRIDNTRGLVVPYNQVLVCLASAIFITVEVDFHSIPNVF